MKLPPTFRLRVEIKNSKTRKYLEKVLLKYLKTISFGYSGHSYGSGRAQGSNFYALDAQDHWDSLNLIFTKIENNEEK